MRQLFLLLSRGLARFGRRGAAAGIAIALMAIGSPGGAGTLADVRERGVLNCGVADLGRFQAGTDVNGRWVGFFADLCRAVAVAVLNDADAVTFMPATMRVRLDALKNGELDALMTPSTWTLEREVDQGLEFPAVALYDGQGFLAASPAAAAALSATAGARLCVVEGTTSERNLSDYIRERGRPWVPVLFKTRQGRNEAMLQNRCDALTGDRLDLAEVREMLRPHGRDLVLLPEVISREPVGPTVRRDDVQWVSVIRWVVFALILAEDKGITAAKAAAVLQPGAPPPGIDDETLRLLGLQGDQGRALGLERGWAARMLAAVGNYGEIFERSLGAGGLKLERGHNALWSRGGLLYSPPFR